MSWFGFDFNGDGKVGFGEHMLTMDMLGFFDEKKQYSVSGCGDNGENYDDAQLLDLDDEIDQLETSRADLEDALLDLELNEPDDVFSLAHEAWEDRRNALEGRLSALDDTIFDLEFEC